MSELNQLSQTDFVAALGEVFEDTPAIAAEAWQHRPFQSLRSLHQVMCQIVESRDRAAQLRLLQAHPDLGSRVKMAPASVTEQAALSLDTLTEAEFGRFQELNQTYRDRFGFPFIVAVRNHSSKAGILQTFAARSQNSPETEFATALSEVMQIAWYRLQDMVQETPDR